MKKNLMLMILMFGILVGASALISAQLAQYTCIDSDGKNYFVKGTTYQVGWQEDNPKKDSCVSQSQVREYSCDSNYPLQIGMESYTCPNGCSDGACVSATGSAEPVKATATKTGISAKKSSSSKTCPASMTDTTSADGVPCCIPKAKATGKFLGFMFRD